MQEADRQYHEVANIFPLMQGEEYEGLKADIKANGLLEPVWLHPDTHLIIDGRNRHRACVELDIAPKFRYWDGKGSLVSFVVSLNLKRRHLTPSQASMVGVEILPMLEEEARTRQIAAGAEFGSLGGRGNKKPLEANLPQGVSESERAPQARDQAAKLVGVSARSIQDAKTVKEHGSVELIAAVKSGQVAVSTAAVIAQAPPEDQVVIVAQSQKDVVKAAHQLQQKRLASKSVKANAKRRSVLSDAGADGRGHDVDAGRSKAPFKTFFRYPGGKGKISGALVNEIVSLAKDGDEYREPFTGGGGVFVPVLASGKFRRMWINDYDYGIYCIWLSVKSFHKDIIDRVCKFTPSVEAFYKYKETLNQDCRHFHPSEVALMKIAIHQMSYSGLGTRAGGPIGGAGQTSQYDVSCRWSADNIAKQICAIYDAMKQVDMVITNMDYRALMTGDNAVMYLDPPYYEQGGNLYHVTFTEQDHKELSERLQGVKFPWLLSYDKCDDVRGLYAWANMRETEEMHYSIALKNGNAGKQSRFASEYLITGGVF